MSQPIRRLHKNLQFLLAQSLDYQIALRVYTYLCKYLSHKYLIKYRIPTPIVDVGTFIQYSWLVIMIIPLLSLCIPVVTIVAMYQITIVIEVLV